MKPWRLLPLLVLAPACFYNYAITASTDGGADAGGDAGPPQLACAAPDAGWPLHCATEKLVLNVPQSGLSTLSMIPWSGGYLVGVVLNQQIGTSGVVFAALALDGGVSDAGSITCTADLAASACVDAQGNPVNFPGFGASLVAASPAPVFVSGYFDASSGGDFTNEFACWTPYDGTASSPLDLGSLNPSPDIDRVRSFAAGGQLAVAISDFIDGVDVLTFGTGTACPGTASVLTADGVAGLDIAPSQAAGLPPFVAAEALEGPNTLHLFLAPNGGAGLSIPSAPSTNSYIEWPAVASDGTSYAALTASDQAGLQLFTGPLSSVSSGSGASIFDGGVIAPPTVESLSATNCGPDCTLALWIQTTVPPSANNEIPSYAFVSSAGCGLLGTLPTITSDLTASVQTAVAYQSGSAAVAYGYNDTNQGQTALHVFVSLCTP